MAKKFAVFDVDGTIIRWQLIHATIDALGKAGHIRPEDYAHIQVARMNWKNRASADSFMAYQAELVRIVEKSIHNVSVQALERATHNIFDVYKDQVYTYTRDLIKQLKKEGYLLFAVSGSHEEAVRLLAEYYGFDDYIASVYERKDGMLTGKIRPITGGKDVLVRQLAEKHGATFAGSIAAGDSESDIGMLGIVEQPIAFNPDRALFRHASKHGWRIVLERKSIVYELAANNGEYVLEHTNV